MNRNAKWIAAVVTVLVTPLLVWAAYTINVVQFLPPQGVVSYKTIQLNGQTGSTAVQDLGVAGKWWVSTKIKVKTVTAAPASAVFSVNSCATSGCTTKFKVATTGQVTLATGTYLLQGWVDDPREYLNLDVGFASGDGGTYDVEFGYVRLAN